MESRWNDAEASGFVGDLAQRVYSSRLLGADPSLVLHGGGNTSVKSTVENFFGDEEEVLYVKGSGWDLATIEEPGFAPVRMKALLELAKMDGLGDAVICREQRAAMTNPSAPDPSVEAILHAVIPFKFVDHTHADAVVALTNTANPEAEMRAVYGERVLIVPYVMPGFTLARAVYEQTESMSPGDWEQYDGMVLLNHGVFTWGESAKQAYERMIDMAARAEESLDSRGALGNVADKGRSLDAARMSKVAVELAELRGLVSRAAGRAMIARLELGARSSGFASLANCLEIGTRGPLTPDHVIRTKLVPLALDARADVASRVDEYVDRYGRYFEQHTNGSHTMLDPAPRWAIWKDVGTVALGDTMKTAGIVADIVDHTLAAIQWSEAIGGWRALGERELFEIEYWELEQVKLRKGGSPPPFRGKVALVTGAASGIGRACAEALSAAGAAVVGLDINSDVVEIFDGSDRLGITCDVTDDDSVRRAIETAVLRFGGLDVLVPNAGVFGEGQTVEAMSAAAWDKNLQVNLTSQQRLLQAAIPFLRHGVEPAVVFIGSKNVSAPGPGAGAYSVSKAGLNQLVRVAALELACDGIRVNVVHPDAVFDTGIWKGGVLERRAEHYGMSVDEYKRRNLLRADITSSDVAEVVLALCSPTFSKTTGAQIPIDGGNERVI